MGKEKSVLISAELYDEVEKRAEETGFDSISEYVEFVLREVIEGGEDEEDEEDFSAEDEEKVKERLRALGYMD